MEGEEGLCLHTNSVTEPDVSLKGEHALWVEIRRGAERGCGKAQTGQTLQQ